MGIEYVIYCEKCKKYCADRCVRNGSYGMEGEENDIIKFMFRHVRSCFFPSFGISEEQYIYNSNGNQILFPEYKDDKNE